LRLTLDGAAASNVVGLVLVLLGGRALFVEEPVAAAFKLEETVAASGPAREPVACKVRALGFSFSAPTVTVRGRGICAKKRNKINE
jgi:hypothetical protein